MSLIHLTKKDQEQASIWRRVKACGGMDSRPGDQVFRAPGLALLPAGCATRAMRLPSLSLTFQRTACQPLHPLQNWHAAIGTMQDRKGPQEPQLPPRRAGKHQGHLLWVVALAGPELNTCATGARAGAKWTPGAPVAISFEDVRCQPDAVSFKAVLKDRSFP